MIRCLSLCHTDYVCVLDIDLLELAITTWKGSDTGKLVSARHLFTGSTQTNAARDNVNINKTLSFSWIPF